MKKLIVFCYVFCRLEFFAQEDLKARNALNQLKHFVDSVYEVNEKWKRIPDTEFIDQPIDPKDPSITRKDTVLIVPETKQNLSWSWTFCTLL